MLKQLELGLDSASLRRTSDEVMMYPESDLAILTQELFKRQSRDDPKLESGKGTKATAAMSGSRREKQRDRRNHPPGSKRG